MANQDFVDRFNSLCEDPLGTPIRLKLNDIYSNPLMSGDVLKDNVVKIYEGFNRLAVLRDDLLKTEALLDILKAHFYEAGAEKRFSPEKLAMRDKIIKRIENELEPYYKIQRKLLNKSLEADRFAVNAQRNCYLRLTARKYCARTRST